MSTRSHGAALSVFAAFVLAALAVFAWRVTAEEATVDKVTVSVDGVRWTSELEDALFVSDSAWPPGQTRSQIFWVRNDAAGPADVDLKVTAVDGETDSGVLEVSAVVGDGDDVQLFTSGRDVNTVRIGTLEQDAREAVTLRAEHIGETELDSAEVRHQISGTGTRVGAPRNSPLDLSDSRLELAPVFLCVALVLTLMVMRRDRRRTSRSRL